MTTVANASGGAEGESFIYKTKRTLNYASQGRAVTQRTTKFIKNFFTIPYRFGVEKMEVLIQPGVSQHQVW